MREVRFAARTLLHARGWTAVVVASLALGIGANTALFSAISGLLLRKLPVRDADSLVRIRAVGPNHVRTDVLVYGHTAPDAQGRDIGPTFSYPMYREFVAANRTMSDVFAGARIGTVNVVVNAQAEIASAFLSSGNYYRALGINAQVGRTIVPDDDRPTAPPVAVISHKYWMSRFGGSANIIGAQAHINNEPVTIVGVLPASFTGIDRVLDDAPDVSMPISLQPQIMLQQSILQTSLLNAPNFWWVEVMGRLKPGVTAVQARDNLAGVFQGAARADFQSFLSSLTPEWRSRLTPKDRRAPELLVDSGSRGVYDADAGDLRIVTVLAAVVVLVLLIVCANVANLILSRATGRQRELAVRLALGATRARLVRQLLIESVLLAGIGGGLGFLAGHWARQLLPMTTDDASPLDWRVLVFAAGLSIATAVIFGLVPALHATTDVNPTLKQTVRGAPGSGSRLGQALVVAQVTISLILLVAAGLFLQTVRNLRTVDVGFNPQGLVLFRISPALNRYDASRRALLYENIGERLRMIAGVTSAAWSNPSLMSGRTFGTAMFIPGRTYPTGRGDQIASISVSPTFFETMEIPLVAGRGFTVHDTKVTPPVAVINEAAARMFFRGQSAIGRHVGMNPADTSIEIIGVIRDAKYNSLRTPAVPTLYQSFSQGNPGSATFEVRLAGDPRGAIAAVRGAVRDVDPNLPLIAVTTGVEEIQGRYADEQLVARAYSFFGGLALLVAALGLFGLMSYNVARRTNEIGVRMALGAERRHVLGLVMRESMRLVMAGIALGISGAVVASRFVGSLMFGIEPFDPLTIAAASLLMVAVSALAGYLPAWRASRVEPLVALRYE